MRRTTWLGEHLDSHVAQKLADRAFRAVERVTFGKAKTVRFKGQRGLHSLEGKTNAACIRWRDDRVLWNGLELPMVKGADRDPAIQHGLASHSIKLHYPKRAFARKGTRNGYPSGSTSVNVAW